MDKTKIFVDWQYKLNKESSDTWILTNEEEQELVILIDKINITKYKNKK